jgi:mono/diheme cytochrome c family protein
MTNKLRVALLLASSLAAVTAWGHDVITTKITWNREITRIVYARCASCHQEGGSAFSLMTYNEARPWAKAIQEEVLERRMPPWGAVKGFGEFRNEQALTPEQIEVIADWVEGGAPEGETKDLPDPPKPAEKAKSADAPTKEFSLSGERKFIQKMVLAGIRPHKIAPNTSFQMTAELPDGSIQPLLWLEPFKPAFSHAFWFKNPIHIPAGTTIRGVPRGATVDLIVAP